ncbi:MAG: hypothetical protein ACI97K_000543 [Glaciecola sp.]|jgi:hypothetical protein
MTISFFSAISLLAAVQGVNFEQSNMLDEALLSKAQDCGAVVNDEQRLVCFDSIFSADLKTAQKSIAPLESVPAPTKILKPKGLADKTPAAVASSVAASRKNTVLPKSIEEAQSNKSKALLVDKFGGEQFTSDKVQSSKLEQITLVIDKVTKTLRKKQVFHFTNGQIWENKTTKQLRVRAGDQVRVKDGALSAFYLSKVGGNGKVRVKRVK